MTDNGINALLADTVNSFIQCDDYLAPVTGLGFAQNYQPRQQGIDSEAVLYFVKVGDHRYGFTGTKDAYDNVRKVMRHVETQVYETTYKILALVPQNPADETGPTESDVLNRVAAIIGSDACRAQLKAGGVGILRVTDVDNPYFKDERNRWEASPSFQIVFTHTRVYEAKTPTIVGYDAAVNRV